VRLAAPLRVEKSYEWLVSTDCFAALVQAIILKQCGYHAISPNQKERIESLEMPHHKRAICPRCGSTFECKMESIINCHCSQVNLAEPQLEAIAQRWDGCLCHACLIAVKAELEKIEEQA
jgi:hypothetical protein